jgi:hypothetical protein
MDHLRGLITLNVDRLTLHELSGFVQDQPPFNEGRDVVVQDTHPTGNETSNLEQEINKLHLEITKVTFIPQEHLLSSWNDFVCTWHIPLEMSLHLEALK